MLRGERPPPPPRPSSRRSSGPETERAPTKRARSAWDILGLAKNAPVLAIKKAYRERALSTHPDRGGEAAEFREVQRAYERLLARRGGT